MCLPGGIVNQLIRTSRFEKKSLGTIHRQCKEQLSKRVHPKLFIYEKTRKKQIRRKMFRDHYLMCLLKVSCEKKSR